MTLPPDNPPPSADTATPETPIPALAAQLGLSAADVEKAWEWVNAFLLTAEGPEEAEQTLNLGQGLDIGALLDRFIGGGNRNLNDLLKEKAAEALARQFNLDRERADILVEALFDRLGKSKRRRGRRTAGSTTAKAPSARATTRSKSTGSTTKSKTAGAAKATRSTTRSKSGGSSNTSQSGGTPRSSGSSRRSKSTGVTKTTGSSTRSKSTASATGSKSPKSSTKRRKSTNTEESNPNEKAR